MESTIVKVGNEGAGDLQLEIQHDFKTVTGENLKTSAFITRSELNCSHDRQTESFLSAQYESDDESVSSYHSARHSPGPTQSLDLRASLRSSDYIKSHHSTENSTPESSAVLPGSILVDSSHLELRGRRRDRRASPRCDIYLTPIRQHDSESESSHQASIGTNSSISRSPSRGRTRMRNAKSSPLENDDPFTDHAPPSNADKYVDHKLDLSPTRFDPAFRSSSSSPTFFTELLEEQVNAGSTIIWDPNQALDDPCLHCQSLALPCSLNFRKTGRLPAQASCTRCIRAGEEFCIVQKKAGYDRNGERGTIYHTFVDGVDEQAFLERKIELLSIVEERMRFCPRMPVLGKRDLTDWMYYEHWRFSTGEGAETT